MEKKRQVAAAADENGQNAILQYLSAAEQDTDDGYSGFGDEEYRIVRKDNDAFVGSYAELYSKFLLSHELIAKVAKEVLTVHGQEMSWSDMVKIVCDSLIENEALGKKFVLEQMKTHLSRLLEIYNNRISP